MTRRAPPDGSPRAAAYAMYRAGNSYDQIATALDIKRTTLANWLHDGRRRKLLKPRRKIRVAAISRWPIERVAAVQDAWDAGLSNAVIAIDFNISQGTVQEMARRFNWTPRETTENRPLTDSQRAWVASKVARGWRMNEIARVALITRERVRQIAEQRGVVHTNANHGNIVGTNCPHCSGGITRADLTLDYPKSLDA